MVVDFNLSELDRVAERVAVLTMNQKVLAFYGEMGAGKTTLIYAICRRLGIKDDVSSPTFSIINEYKTDQGDRVYHLDLYRLEGEQEAISAGVEDCLHSGNICFIEWPERVPGLLPAGTLHCYLKHTGLNERKLQINL
jgi:tRNA threonylcarbamoyladenosine biosynthesis protein TsaE